MKRVAVAMGAAVVLGSGAYALGTQSDDGSAAADPAAATAPAGYGYGGGPGGPMRGFHGGSRGAELSDLATKLKVDESKLQQALEEIRAERQKGDGPAKELAAALGLPVEKVRAALAKLRPMHRERRGLRRDGFLAAAAKSLGVSEQKLAEALGPVGPGAGHPGPGGDPADRLGDAAKKLGVSEDKLRSALRDARPDFKRDDHARGPFGADLAKALGVSTDKLDAALAKLRDSHQDERDQFAAKLADKLGIPESRVKAALPSRRFGGPPGFGGRRGPGPGGPQPGGAPGGPPPGGPPGGP